MVYLQQGPVVEYVSDLFICQPQQVRCEHFQRFQFLVRYVCPLILLKAEHENPSFLTIARQQGPVTTTLATYWLGNSLFVDPTAQIRINQAAFHLINGIHKQFFAYGSLFEPAVE